MKKIMQHTMLLIPLLLICAACQNEGRWYPEAEASVAGPSEYIDALGGKHLSAAVVVHNTGSASILSSTVTVRAVTDKREYLQTTAFAGKIIPGGTVALTVSIAYLEPGESLQPGGASVYSSFFD